MIPNHLHNNVGIYLFPDSPKPVPLWLLQSDIPRLGNSEKTLQELET